MLPSPPPPARPPLPVWTDADKYHVLSDSIDEGFCVIEMLFDAQGCPHDYRFVETNPALQRQTGFETDVVGRCIRELAPTHEQHWYDIYGRVATTGESIRFEQRAEALHRWYDVYAFRVGQPEQHLVGVLFNDISGRKATEHALHEADRRKDEFISILAHELRNPLAPMRNALQILRIAKGDTAIVERAQAMLERQVEQMVTLVDDLMDVRRITSGTVKIERRRLDLARVVRHAVEAAEPAVRSRGHTLAVQLPREAVWVDVDDTRMTQALSNLLINAAKYTDPGGRLLITLQQRDAQAWVSVADNGIGIPADMLERVFDLFTQVSQSRVLTQGGLGIGLAIVRQIVAMHGGVVTAESAGAGQGSRFTVCLPLSTLEPAVAEAASTQAPPAQRRRVLVVDDNVDAAESLATMLALQGHEVRTAFDGEEALTQAEALQPDVVLLDIGMPRLNGLEVARALRHRPWGRHAMLVAVTGWGQEADRAATRDAGFDHHLVKPIRPSALQAALAGERSG